MELFTRIGRNQFCQEHKSQKYVEESKEIGEVNHRRAIDKIAYDTDVPKWHANHPQGADQVGKDQLPMPPPLDPAVGSNYGSSPAAAC